MDYSQIIKPTLLYIIFRLGLLCGLAYVDFLP